MSDRDKKGLHDRMKELDRLLEVAAKRDRPADQVWPAAAAAIELLWWHDRFDDAEQLATTTIRDLADEPGRLFGRDYPFDSAFLAAADRHGADPGPRLVAARAYMPPDSVMGKRFGWLLASLLTHPPHELTGGYVWGKQPQPFKPRDQALADQPPADLTDAERTRLYNAAHNRRQFPTALHLFEATKHYPPQWYVAVWMAGELSKRGQTELATAFLTDALPDWAPYEPWDLVPTEPCLQPLLRPAATEQLRSAILATVDISRVPGVAP
ncbi:hypothetical protein [Amycolatopsis pigmentata]|uniref:Tetratricopeptide repeat protein n=1 Tax=Amycolatopsis pigmentata TaxID=450801 RepID=A0ABW5G578_9PSEU